MTRTRPIVQEYIGCLLSMAKKENENMQRYEIKWAVNLNPTEIEILLEEWKGFFEVKEVASIFGTQTIEWTVNLNPTEIEILLEEWKGFFEIKEVA